MQTKREESNKQTNVYIGNEESMKTSEFCHRSLRVRSAEFNNQLNLSDEMEWDKPVGSEMW
jgi:hypothetical protein